MFCSKKDKKKRVDKYCADADEVCKHFKDKSQNIELPCKVNDTFCCLSQYAEKGELQNKYFIDERQVSCLEYDGTLCVYDYDGIDFSLDDIFFDKSKAEAKLKELNDGR